MPLFGPKKPEKKPIFSKFEDNELPELPEASGLESIKYTIGQMPEESSEFPRLPQARLTPSANFFSEEATKASELPEAPEEQPRPFAMPSPRGPMFESPSRTFIKETRPKFKEPIFVKIEKFRESIEHIESINKKIQELVELMEKIKQTRAKEEEEITRWEKEILDIKEKLVSIDQKLFSRLE